MITYASSLSNGSHIAAEVFISVQQQLHHLCCSLEQHSLSRDQQPHLLCYSREQPLTQP